jgi:hypothetical protein
MKKNSSKRSSGKTLAERRLLDGLQELVNLQETEEAFDRFSKRWPDLAPVSEAPDDALSIDATSLPRKYWLSYDRKADLIEIWEGNHGKLSEFLLPLEPPEEIRGEHIDMHSSENQAGKKMWIAPVKLDWGRSEIEYVPQTEFQRAIYALFKNHTKVTTCGNPECPAPYFVGMRASQRYCSEACAEVFQREAKRKWWAERGEEWRSKRVAAKKVSRPSGRRSTSKRRPR